MSVSVAGADNGSPVEFFLWPRCMPMYNADTMCRSVSFKSLPATLARIISSKNGNPIPLFSSDSFSVS